MNKASKRVANHGRVFFVISVMTTSLAASSLLGACSSSDEDEEKLNPASGSLVQNGRIAAQLQGIWRVVGQGALLDVGPTSAVQYQQGETLCYVDEDASTDNPADLAGQSFSGSFGRHRANADLYELAGAAPSATLERIAALPQPCRSKPASTPANSFKALCELMGQDYAYFVQRHIDWTARCQALTPRAAAAANDDALQAVLVDALSGFNDPHIKLYRGHGEARQQVFSSGNSATGRLLRRVFEQQTEIDDFRVFQAAWREELQAQVSARLQSPSGLQLDEALQWGRLPGNVGYLALYRMGSFAPGATPADDVRLIRQTLDRALAELADTRALIVDVALNGGGLDNVSAELAASFADQRRLVFTKQWHRTEGRPPQPWYVEPKGASRYRKPVYLLTSDATGSAAETFCLMMRQFPQVIQVGQTTAGALADVLDKPLPGNFSVSFSSEIVLDPQGRLFEVSGIPPTWPLTLFDPADEASLLTGHGAAISAVLQMIGR